MPSRNTTRAAESNTAALPSIPKELIGQFVSGPMSAEAVNAASPAFKKALIERALDAELSHHLGYPTGGAKPKDTGAGARRKSVSGGNICPRIRPTERHGLRLLSPCSPAALRLWGRGCQSQAAGQARLRSPFPCSSALGRSRRLDRVTSRRNPATRSRHIPASFAGAEGRLERPRFEAYFDALPGLSCGAFFDGGGTRGSRYDGPVSSRQ